MCLFSSWHFIVIIQQKSFSVLNNTEVISRVSWLFDDTISGLKSTLGLRRGMELACHANIPAINFLDKCLALFPPKAKIVIILGARN
jgi:hypothetical protein